MNFDLTPDQLKEIVNKAIIDNPELIKERESIQIRKAIELKYGGELDYYRILPISKKINFTIIK